MRMNKKYAYGNLIDRDLTQTAFAMLNNDQEEVDSQKLGEMINQHHEMLKSYDGFPIRSWMKWWKLL